MELFRQFYSRHTVGLLEEFEGHHRVLKLSASADAWN